MKKIINTVVEFFIDYGKYRAEVVKKRTIPWY